MKFRKIFEDSDHLWSVVSSDSDIDELALLFDRWRNIEYLFEFFTKNREDLQSFFRVDTIGQAVRDTLDDADALEALVLEFPFTEHLDEVFKPLGIEDEYAVTLNREKARNWNRKSHPSWLRIYAVRLEEGVYVITGGAIKLTAAMQDRPHTQKELDKLNECLSFLKGNGVFDKDSFIDLQEEL